MRPLSVLSLLILAACDSGSGGGVFGGGGGSTVTIFCDTLVGPGASVAASVDPGCTDCEVEGEAAVADDLAATFATITVRTASSDQGVAIRANAPTGVVYSGGRKAGAFLSYPRRSGGAVVQGVSTTLRTYVNGLPLESAGSGDSVGTSGFLNRRDFGEGSDGLPRTLIWFETTLDFDAVEIHIAAPQVQAQPRVFRVYENCHDTAVTES